MKPSPHDLSWTQRAFEYMRSFPQPDILVVVAPTPERVEEATTKALTARRDVIRAAHQPQSGEFFERNGLLYLPRARLRGLRTAFAMPIPFSRS